MCPIAERPDRTHAWLSLPSSVSPFSDYQMDTQPTYEWLFWGRNTRQKVGTSPISSNIMHVTCHLKVWKNNMLMYNLSYDLYIWEASGNSYLSSIKTASLPIHASLNFINSISYIWIFLHMPLNRTVNDIKFCRIMLLIDAKMFSFFTQIQSFTVMYKTVCVENSSLWENSIILNTQNKCGLWA